MLKSTTAAVFAAAGIAAMASAAPALAQGGGVDAGKLSLVNVDASNAAQWQICGQNILAQPGPQDCDNSSGGSGAGGVDAGALSLVNADASNAAKWQICGQNVLAQPMGQDCFNALQDDPVDPGKGKGIDQGDF